MQTIRSEFEIQIARLKEMLATPLPGLSRCMEMAPQNPNHRPVAEARERGCKEGSVLLLLYPMDGVAHIVLTERSHQLRNHAGQVSLPGGRRDPGEDAVQCALREAWEEIGVVSEEIEVLGILSNIYVPPSNYCLTPVVAVTPLRPTFIPHDAEVASIVEVPVTQFVGPTHRRAELRLIEGQERRIPYYEFGDHKIWGGTAMILTEFGTLWGDALEMDEE